MAAETLPGKTRARPLIISSPPMIQNMSNPRSASSDTRRPVPGVVSGARVTEAVAILLRQSAGLADGDMHHQAAGRRATALSLEHDFVPARLVRRRSEKFNFDRIILSRRHVIYRVSCFV